MAIKDFLVSDHFEQEMCQIFVCMDFTETVIEIGLEVNRKLSMCSCFITRMQDKTITKIVIDLKIVKDQIFGNDSK
jgi:hypothetical protein